MECFLVNLHVNKYQVFSSKIFKTHRLYKDFKMLVLKFGLNKKNKINMAADPTR
jgi:hypothetical protein